MLETRRELTMSGFLMTQSSFVRLGAGVIVLKRMGIETDRVGDGR